MTMRLDLPLERIGKEAKAVDGRKLLLTLLVAIPISLGWTARKVWYVVAFFVTSVKVGWELAGKSGDTT